MYFTTFVYQVYMTRFYTTGVTPRKVHPMVSRYPTPTGRDEVAESVAGFLRRNPDGSLIKAPFGVPMLVWHGLVPPSPHHRSIMS